MADPVRVQLSRQRGFRLQHHSMALNGLPAVKVTRPGPFGNPYKIDRRERDWEVFLCTDGKFAGPPVAFALTQLRATAKAVECFEKRVTGEHGALLRRRAVAELRNKNLACWCRLDQPCHADVLLRLANPVCEEVNDG